jgi:hypothetical protein
MNELKQKGIEIKDNLMQAIRDGKIEQHSKWYFVLRASAWTASFLLIVLLTVYVISFISFSLEERGILLLSSFGAFGLLSIINDLPWLLIGLSILGLVSIVLVARSAYGAYRAPMLYLFFGVIGAVLISVHLARLARVHPIFFARAHPIIRAMYMHYANPEDNRITVGYIVGPTTDNSFIVKTRHSDIVEVATSTVTQVLPLEVFSDGDEILIFGDVVDGQLSAKALRKISDSEKGGLFDVEVEDENEDDSVR